MNSSYRLIAFILLAVSLATSSTALSQNEGRHAILIGGLGGSPDYSARFEQYLFDSRNGLIENFGFSPGNVVVLGETAISDRSFVDDVATSDNIRASFSSLEQRVKGGDLVLIILFGHGSYDGTVATTNIPRRDLSDRDYAALVDKIPTSNVIFINTTSASGPFIRSLSYPERVVITATKSGGQTNETRFPRFLVEGLSGQLADLDRDGSVSIAEIFGYAAESTAREYASNDLLATEHALLDDDGDGVGHQFDEQVATGDGNVASFRYLSGRGSEGIAASGDYLTDRSDLERQIADVKRQKDSLVDDDYYGQLEVLFVQLARLNEILEGSQ